MLFVKAGQNFSLFVFRKTLTRNLAVLESSDNSVLVTVTIAFGSTSNLTKELAISANNEINLSFSSFSRCPLGYCALYRACFQGRYFSISDPPVIAFGFSTPIICKTVGATSASFPLLDKFSPFSTTINGTMLPVCAVCA